MGIIRALFSVVIVAAAAALPASAQTILINQLDDMPLGSWSGAGNMAMTTNHCVGPSTTRFRVTAAGSGPGGAFTLSNGLTALPYRLEYAGRTGGFQLMSPGVPLTGLTGDTLNQCRNQTRQSERVRVTLLATDLETATAGAYSGTLTLTVAPE